MARVELTEMCIPQASGGSTRGAGAGGIQSHPHTSSDFESSEFMRHIPRFGGGGGDGRRIEGEVGSIRDYAAMQDHEVGQLSYHQQAAQQRQQRQGRWGDRTQIVGMNSLSQGWGGDLRQVSPPPANQSRSSTGSITSFAFSYIFHSQVDGCVKVVLN